MIYLIKNKFKIKLNFLIKVLFTRHQQIVILNIQIYLMNESL